MSNLTEINIIESLLSEVNKHLEEILPENQMQRTAKEQAIEEMAAFQADEIYQLRTMCEDEQ
jgi:hypothetical protein